MVKRILFLVCVGGYSGAENMTLLIGENLVERGYDVYYCSPRGEIETYISQYYKKIKYEPLSKYDFGNIHRAIKKVVPDLLYCVDFKVSMMGSLLTQRYIVHLHNNPKWIRNPSPFTLLLCYAMNHSIGNICVSDSVMNEFVFSSWINKKTKTIYNVVDKNRVINMAQEALGEDYDIAFFGRITEQKDPLRFLKLIERINAEMKKNYKAIMIGPDGGMMEVCKKVVSEGNVNVAFSGFQNNPYKYIQNCKLVLMPSKWEGFGLTAVESMLLGKPVIATPVGGLPMVIGTEENLCVTDAQFIRRMKTLLMDEEVYKESSLLARKQAKKFCDIMNYVDQIEAVWSE